MRLLGQPLRRGKQWVPTGLGFAAPSTLLRSHYVTEPITAGLPVVYACLHLITQRLASMPMRVFDADRRELPLPVWLRRPTEATTGADLISSMAVDLVQHGNTYLLPVRNEAGRVALVYVTPHQRVNVHLMVDGQVDYIIGGQRWEGELVHARYIALPGDVRGLSAWQAAQRALTIGASSQDFIERHFAQSAHLQVAIVAKGTVTKEEQRKLAAQIRAQHYGDPARAWSPLVLDNDVDVKSMSMTAEQAQFVELTQMTGAQIASQIFRVDPSLVGIAQSGSSLTYSNLVDREAQLYRDAIRPLAYRIEQTLTSLLPAGQTLDLDARALLAGSPRDAAQLAATLKQTGCFTINEVRERLGYDAIDGGDDLAAATPPNIIFGHDFPEPSAGDDDED